MGSREQKVHWHSPSLLRERGAGREQQQQHGSAAAVQVPIKELRHARALLATCQKALSTVNPP